tara:strand:+ start:657 stop:1376 length:720 start_codon:yes stop_codon:yes gene_type:complete
MKIEIIPCLQDNYCYLIIDEKRNIACAIDPGEASPIINFLKNKKIQLKYILNTHHHHDHIGGNSELKNKYDLKIVGFKNDRKRIPDIDILVEDNEVWKEDGFEAKILHVPGHTSGHICFYFFKEKLIFTGDTLFSLGCGRIFEGTYSQMYNSLKKIKYLPEETKVFCGHEYTKQNAEFCITQDKNNKKLKNKISEINDKIRNNFPTVPSTIKEELECNIFLKSENLETFSKLRDLKDNF